MYNKHNMTVCQSLSFDKHSHGQICMQKMHASNKKKLHFQTQQKGIQA